MKALRLFIFAMAPMLMLTGCGEAEHEDIKKWMAESSRDMRGRVPPLPELRPFPVISYQAHNEMDPFSANRVEAESKAGGSGLKPDFDRPREQLEKYPLESIQFIGAVSKSKSGDQHALVKVDGVVYQARKGNFMGQNYGRIVEVTDTTITLNEIVQDPTGQTTDWVEKQTTLQLLEGPQGKESRK